MRSRYPYRPTTSDFGYSFGPGPITPIVKALIIANVAAFVGTWIAGDIVPRPVYAANAKAVVGYLGLMPQLVLESLQVWRLFTFQFLHAGILHLLFNMLALWMFGVEFERRWGSAYFLKYYLVCSVGAALTTVLLSLLPWFEFLYVSNTIGASGSVYGILLAFALYFPTRPILMFFVFPVPARYAVMIMGGIALISSFDGPGGTAHTAHLGGMLTGYLFLKGGSPGSLRLGRLHLISEIQYRILKWRINRSKRRFDVYQGGRRADDVDRRVH